MKTTANPLIVLTLLAASVLARAGTVEVPAMEKEKLCGRCQYGAVPGSGAGSMKFVDASLPQAEVRVGATAEAGVGMGYLIGFELDPEMINSLAMGTKVELVVTVLKTALGGTPSPTSVALLSSSSPAAPDMRPQFGAWNNAPNLTEVGTFEADPEIGEARFDITEALQKGTPPSQKTPVIYFAIYAPKADLVKENHGKHVIFGGQAADAPRLVITE